MERLNDINNYLIVENGTVKEYEFQQNIKVIDHHLTIYEDAKIQIIYLLTQPDQYCFDLTIQDHTKVDLIEMYEASCQCSFHKNLIVKDNSFVTRYVENGSYSDLFSYRTYKSHSLVIALCKKKCKTHFMKTRRCGFRVGGNFCTQSLKYVCRTAL